MLLIGIPPRDRNAELQVYARFHGLEKRKQTSKKTKLEFPENTLDWQEGRTDRRT